ncbi:MAG: helicase-related protein [Ktedonobacteraceae bacterium]
MSMETPLAMQDLLQRALHHQVRLSEYSHPVYIEEADDVDGLISLTVRTRDGQSQEILISPSDLEIALQEVTQQGVERVPVNSQDFFLQIEAARIRLAYSFDPFFAVSMSGVQALPHQLQAVYERMLPQARLRFLLADDPGAGKTIMAGLLLKELKLRGVINYVLILTPAPLTVQWQDELYSKFDETFEVISSDMVGNQLAGNLWERYRQCIASVDFVKQEHILRNLEQVPWDLVIIDEAHKCSARTQGEKVSKTRRYQMAERISASTERLLLLTATPHSGNPDQFAHFLRLLDADQFPDPRYDGLAIDREVLTDTRTGGRDQWFLRRIKEELLDRDGNKLFKKRDVGTVPFKLTYTEEKLYDHVTEYINRFLPHQQGNASRRNSVALARTVLQRRLASSLHAIHNSLERRAQKFRDIVEELERNPKSEHEKILQKHRLWASSGYEDDERESGDLDEAQDDAMESFPVALRIDQLGDEIRALEKLIQETINVMESGEEAKLKALRDCLQGEKFRELTDQGQTGVLLIFTEHRDTLNYLRKNLRGWGYTTCEIHGGMNAVQRREAAQRFFDTVQICLATEAAGEGINLQFCHLMINYDVPWNPNRLEQRMGRIHRIGQKHDVSIFNFVATNTVEGKILARLFTKLEEIRKELKDRVFDVIGPLLRANEINLEDMLRGVAINRNNLEEYEGQIERLSSEQLKQLEEATGVALAKSHVDLSWMKGVDIRSQERRLMPEYVQKFFLRAAERVKMKIYQRINQLFTIEHVPQALRNPQLASARRNGLPEQEYKQVTFDKAIQQDENVPPAILLSPGHPLFAALTEVLLRDLETTQGQAALFVDPRATESYQVHFFEVQIVTEDPLIDARRGGNVDEGRTQVLYSTMAAILDGPHGREQAPADLLHDLTPLEESARLLDNTLPELPDPSQVTALEKWVRVKVQFPMKQEQARERQRLLQIRREYVTKMFDEQIKRVQSKWMKLYQRVQKGDDAARLARDEADKRQKELKIRKREKLEELDRLQVVREGAVRYMGTAQVVPIAATSLAAEFEQESHIPTGKLVRDDEIERIGMEYVMAYERAQGRQPEDISKNYDGSGFDIRSLGPDDIRRIEVKSRARAGEFVELTPNEWLQAHRHGDSYWLYVVWSCATEPHLIMIQNPAQNLAQFVQEQIVIEGYRVPGEVIQRWQERAEKQGVEEK